MNLRIHSSGHWYFSLKDNNSQIKCTMFRYANSKASFTPKNGDLLQVVGSVDFYNPSGDITFNIKSIQMAGIGNFYIQFEQTKRKLEPLGYFAPEHKKPIPVYPKTISVVTGNATAALRDVQVTLAKRWPVELRIVPAIVQGKEAILSIVQGLKIADQQHSDIILLVRGGGSIDDLWCFNDESIAKAIYQCETPVITGIGHEIDTTIADLVADKRAATPTAAAVAATPDSQKIIEKLDLYQQNLIRMMQSKLDSYVQYSDQCNARLQSYLTILERQKLHVSDLQAKMSFALNQRIQQTQGKLDVIGTNLCNYTNNQLIIKQNQFHQIVTLLDSLSPLKTISRGYIISRQNDKIIKSVEEIDQKQPLKLTYIDGSVIAKIEKKEQ